MPKVPLLILAIFVLAACAFVITRMIGSKETQEKQALQTGEIVASYRTIPVYSNGNDYTKSHGKHYSDQGYYYGQKWQCVEFVKRFYHDAFDHNMPSVWGHARDFYNAETPHGSLNLERGMIQFQNGGNMAPRPDDLLVFGSTRFGHVAVITAVRDDEIEVVQQNIAGKPRQTHPLEAKNGSFVVGTQRNPTGWLRLPQN